MANQNGYGYPDANGHILGANGRPYRSPEDGQALPHRVQFAATTRITLHDRYDEALRRGREEANSMRRDAFIAGLLQERTLGVTSLKFRVDVPNDRDPQQKAIKDGLQTLWDAIPFRQQMIYALQEETTWVGRGATQLIWHYQQKQLPQVKVKSFGTGMGMGMGGAPPNPALAGAPPTPGMPGAPPQPGMMGAGDQSMAQEARKACCIKAWQPVSGDSIGHTPDGSPYLLVNSAEADRIPGAQVVLTNYGKAVLLVGQWRTRFILDSHIPTAAEFFDWEKAEAIHGVGLRTLCFWRNFMRLEHDESVNSWIQRVGLGVRVWKFQSGNAQSKAAVEEASAEQTDTVNILVPVVGERGIEGVEFLETASTGADLLLKLLEHEEAMLERLIIGSENSMGSGGGQGDSLGGEGKSRFQQGIKNKIAGFDAQNRADALTEGWAKPTLRWTYPHFWDLPVRMVVDVDEQDPDKLLTAADKFVRLKGKVSSSYVGGVLGFPEPKAGEELLSAEQPSTGGGMSPGPEGTLPGADGQPAAGGAEPNPAELTDFTEIPDDLLG